MSHLNGDETRASAYTTLLLCDLYDACSAKESRTVLAEEIRRYINLNLNSAISNTGIARHFDRSVKTVEAVFKKQFGITIHKYILTERLKKGKSFLEFFPHMSIRDVAEETFFYDEYHFSRVFKKEFGVPPTVYRKTFFSDNAGN